MWCRGRVKHHLLHMPGVSKVFSYKRYKFITSVLHYCDEEAACSRDDPDFDRLYKIRYLTNYLNAKFREHYRPGREISVDEGMIPFRGRWSGKQYHRDKPIRWGVKTWMLCDATSGYNYNFDVYCGKDKDFGHLSTIGLATAVVLKLCQPLFDKGHIIYTDRFYTSATLLKSLRHVGLSCCGTVMTNRKFFPTQLVKPKSQCKVPGESEWVQCKKSGIVATRWVDKSPIYFLSNAHVAAVDGITVSRTTNPGTTVLVPATPTVVEYNKFMGGVDQNDKMTRMDKARKSYKWYTKIDRKSVLWANYNSFVLYKETHPNKDYRDFTLDVIHELIGSNTFKAKRQSVTPSSSTLRVDGSLPHSPAVDPTGSNTYRCKVCEEKHARERRANPGKNRSELSNKSVKTTFICTTCNAHLCIKRNSNCWEGWHNKEEYWL